MGPGVDKIFDELLHSFGKMAQIHAKPVVDSIMRWRRSQNASPSPSRTHDIPALLNERKSQILEETTTVDEGRT
jgi:polyhydroxyalkanoate synthesis regulator phasin